MTVTTSPVGRWKLSDADVTSRVPRFELQLVFGSAQPFGFAVGVRPDADGFLDDAPAEFVLLQDD